jgi:hypothetical protein
VRGHPGDILGVGILAEGNPRALCQGQKNWIKYSGILDIKGGRNITKLILCRTLAKGRPDKDRSRRPRLRMAYSSLTKVWSRRESLSITTMQ